MASQSLYKPIERQMLQLQKVSKTFHTNVERVAGINKSLVGFHSVFTEFIAGTKAAASRLDVPQENVDPQMKTGKKTAPPTAAAPAVQAVETQAPIAKKSSMKKAPAAKKGKKAELEAPQLTGPQKAQAGLKALVPPKFQGESHLKGLYIALRAASRHPEEGCSLAAITTETMIGKVQLEEYLTVLSRCGQLSKVRTTGLKFKVCPGSVLEAAGVGEEA